MPNQRLMLNFWGKELTVTIYDVNKNTFTKLGLNPAIFKSGVKVYVLDEKNFCAFCEQTQEAPSPLVIPPKPGTKMIEIPTKEVTPNRAIDIETSQALYPLSKRGELDAVRRGEIDFLPSHSRVILLHENFTALELTHELIHDIFLGPLCSYSDRMFFILCLIDSLKKAYADCDAAVLKFFEEVNNRCQMPYQIDALKNQEISLRDPLEIGPNLFTYAGECFVYAWETLLGYEDQALGKVPAELQDLLEKYPIR